jgi:hypothetical protein
MDLAHDLGAEKGYELYSKDPIKAAQYKLAMESFNRFV